jgi:hypothetical protein
MKLTQALLKFGNRENRLPAYKLNSVNAIKDMEVNNDNW